MFSFIVFLFSILCPGTFAVRGNRSRSLKIFGDYFNSSLLFHDISPVCILLNDSIKHFIFFQKGCKHKSFQKHTATRLCPVDKVGLQLGRGRRLRPPAGGPGRGSDMPPACHSLPLPSKPLMPAQKRLPLRVPLLCWQGKKASNRIWVFFDTFNRHFTSIFVFLRTFPNRSDHCIFFFFLSWGSSKGSKRTPKAVRRVS